MLAYPTQERSIDTTTPVDIWCQVWGAPFPKLKRSRRALRLGDWWVRSFHTWPPQIALPCLQQDNLLSQLPDPSCSGPVFFSFLPFTFLPLWAWPGPRHCAVSERSWTALLPVLLALPGPGWPLPPSSALRQLINSIHNSPQVLKAGRKLWDHLIQSPNFVGKETEEQEGHMPPIKPHSETGNQVQAS